MYTPYFHGSYHNFSTSSSLCLFINSRSHRSLPDVSLVSDSTWNFGTFYPSSKCTLLPVTSVPLPGSMSVHSHVLPQLPYHSSVCHHTQTHTYKSTHVCPLPISYWHCLVFDPFTTVVRHTVVQLFISTHWITSQDIWCFITVQDLFQYIGTH